MNLESNTGKYCCFNCPGHDYSPKSLNETCSSCGRNYGFPLTDFPVRVRDYTVVRPLGRGFYGATYLVERGLLRRQVALKVVPKSLYAFFGKDFVKECQYHAEIADDTEHVVSINDRFDETVEFGSESIPCHVAELEYVNGDPLSDILQGAISVSSPDIAQISLDLLRIRGDLYKKSVNHNDLHAANIIVRRLGRDAARPGSISPRIRAVAIDLGSLSERSRSGEQEERLGDIHAIAQHLDGLLTQLLREPDQADDRDYRLANSLQLIIQNLSALPEHQRTPLAEDHIQQIEEAFWRASAPWKPWRESLVLKTFESSYNAQTLEAWHVPKLLEDPAGRWLQKISVPGPQVITGMRGCGKTMLLKALQFHARATPVDSDTEQDITARLSEDGYIGLYVSAQRLLDQPGLASERLHQPFAPLILAYTLEALRALQHLADIDASLVDPRAYALVAAALAQSIPVPNGWSDSVESIYRLEGELIRMLLSLSRGEEQFDFAGTPSSAFPHLAETLRSCSPIWRGSRVLFLLDDVSTRYLREASIVDLLSDLLFQDPSCAFKITSEAQTVELGLKSPGQIHHVREGRDLRLFDLGAEVYEQIKSRGRRGKEFLGAILEKRGRYYPGHPQASSFEILGDSDLETIAIDIATSRNSSRERKRIYRGLTALTHVCVGDIGDAIGLYDRMIESARGKDCPIAPEIQSDCFQRFCASRLYDLNRQRENLIDFAKTFAEASNRLLVESHRKILRGEVTRKRVRQYLSIYVRVTTGDSTKQIGRLRDLIDAGVFVFAGGSDVPRAKTRDSDPIQQFKLTFRKIYGIVSFVGLAESDRFELSGSALEEWLDHPERGTEILLRNLSNNDEDDKQEEDGDEIVEASTTVAAAVKPKVSVSQRDLYPKRVPPMVQSEGPQQTESSIHVQSLDASDLAGMEFGTAIAGLGFEERTLVSAERLAHIIRSKRAVLIRYQEKGNAEAIEAAFGSMVDDQNILDYESDWQVTAGISEGPTIVDVTGLAKPTLFFFVRETLRQQKSLYLCYTAAAEYYPLQQDLEAVLRAEQTGDQYALLGSLRHVLTGEDGPYSLEPLLDISSDESRSRCLCVIASSKHERLLSLLDDRDADCLEIIVSGKDDPRNRIARIVAEIAAARTTSSAVHQIGSNELVGILGRIELLYNRWYVQRGFNFEIGLTGSKLQAVAAAALSAKFKISQCWYTRPKKFDAKKFTKGVGESMYLKLSIG